MGKLTDGLNIFWDACVLYRFLRNEPTDFVDHISAYVADAEAGRLKIYMASITLAELRPSIVKLKGETPANIINRLCSFAIMIDTSPDIMSLAGLLKDNKYICSTDDPKAEERCRPLSTGDAIQLASAIDLRENWGVQGLVLHTFDEGMRSSKEEGKTVPMIGFQNWCKGLEGNEKVDLVRELKRMKPVHASCPIPTTTK
jgi:predicted nucleic acid-binding protein